MHHSRLGSFATKVLPRQSSWPSTLLLTASLGGAVAMLAPGASAQDLYDTSVLRTLNFQFHDANWWSLLQANYVAQTNILADLTVDGITYTSVGVRIRGNTSYTALPAGSQKVSLNVEMDFVVPGQTLLGYDSLNLNNAFRDPTFCREVVYNNFVSRFMPNARANHVVVNLNGANWGVYANVQQYNKDLLRPWFDDEDGMRIKCANNPNGPGLRYNGNLPSGYTGYEVKNDGGLADPIGALIAVCNSVTNEPLATWQNIDTLFAIDAAAWSTSLENLLTDDDSYVNKGADFMLYRNPADGRTHLHQTDANETFTQTAWSPTRNFTSVNKPVLSRVFSVSEPRQRYMAHMRAALADLTPAYFDPIFAAHRSLIDAAVQADPKKIYTYQNFLDNFTQTVTLPAGGLAGGTIVGLSQFVTGRATFVSGTAEVVAQGPVISSVQHLPATPAPSATVWVTAAISASTSPIAGVELLYLPAPGPYLRTPMLDDGLSGDGAAGDGVFGAVLPVTATAGQRVKYYVMAKSANAFSSMTLFPVTSENRPNHVDYAFGSAGVRITEYMYSGTNGEFVELTNVTAAPIDLTGWSLDDDSGTAGTFSLSGAGVLAPGQSVLITDLAPATFAANWGLTGVTILGPNSTAALGRNDQINLYDATNGLVERLSYGDESFPGSIRTQNTSGQICREAIGQNSAHAWVLSAAGDAYGSFTSIGGNRGTPGTFVDVSCNGAVGTGFCFGDGSGLACPCANNGGTGRGCANSAFPSGASLSATGLASVGADTVVLASTGMTGAIALFFQGTTQEVPVAVDDGIGCVGGSIVRLTTKPVGGSNAFYPEPGDQPVSVRGALPLSGGTYQYQCFYRNASTSFCPPATSNRTNGWTITWTP